MSTSIQTVEFERREAFLSELDEGPPFTVHGVALGAGDVTVGQSGIKKLWPADALKESADSLEGRNLVVDHNNDSSGVIGQVTKAGYKDNVGVIYQAELFDEDLAEKISNGLLEVSIRGKHSEVEQMDETDDGAKVVENITFDNLSVVPTGAAPSNSIEMGETDELSMAELSEFTDSLESAELEEIEPGMWVQSNGTKGIVLSQVEDGDVELDVYEEIDGKWRSTGETTEMNTGELTQWDVDEEEDIGAQKDDESEEEASEELIGQKDKVQWGSDDSMTRGVVVDRQSEGCFEERLDADRKVCAEDGDAVLLIATVTKEGDSYERTGTMVAHRESEVEQTDFSLEERRVEGEEEYGDTEDIKEQSPERYPEADGEAEELQDYSYHTPDWDGTTTDEWSSPDYEEFKEPYNIPDDKSFSELDDDMKSAIAEHFLISAGGFPPEEYGDLKLPVVEPNGELSRNALEAVKGGHGAQAVEGLGSDLQDKIVSWVNETANEEFDENWGSDEEEAAHGDRKRTVDDTGSEPGVEDGGPVDIALELINKYLTIEGTHERDSVDKMLSWLVGSVDLPLETIGDFRVAAKRFLDETPGTDSFDGLTVEQFRDWLLMHGKESRGRREQDKRDRMPRGEPSSVNVLTGDDLQQLSSKSGESELDDTTYKVTNMTEDIEEKLAELSEPVAVEQSDLEELQDKADRFDEMSETLESLKERTDILDSVDRDKLDELSEAEEPVVVESARFESLEQEAEQVKTVYAAALSEEMPAFSGEELADRFSIEELREKYEEQIGDPAEELASSESAEPRSGDVDEEELEERAEEEEEEELEPSESDEAEAMRAELREKITG